ncbi:MAG: hypothetical protein KYX67_08960 [Brevundimonas sp.]|jgi:hypothetical protein|uniref:Uncharacterized protein n=1 Tax=Brevundimonas mediterranea TaxID=74329 RepID=A0A7W6F1M7_9CAUL|nr:MULTISPECIES: hypothetical protein [Brevundimonas]MBB3873642.1 hypothetical protein [Brevundimonas mediterranea]MDK2747435.1 hypothetical protein [Brevundimonas sp.]
MTRFVSPALIAAALAAVATPSLAQASRSEAPRAATLQSVMVCASDTATRRAYQREFGAAPVFVTAQEAIAARQAGQRWTAPRCMTAHQYNRLVSSTQTRASL